MHAKAISLTPEQERSQGHRKLDVLIITNAGLGFLGFAFLVFVVPVFVALLASAGARLAAPTQFVVDLSSLAKS